MYELNKPKYYKEKFDGSNELFKICWLRYTGFLKGSIDYPSCDDDVMNWLNTIASELVNSPRSKFYMYG